MRYTVFARTSLVMKVWKKINAPKFIPLCPSDSRIKFKSVTLKIEVRISDLQPGSVDKRS